MKHFISFEEERIVYVRGRIGKGKLIAEEVWVATTPGAIMNGRVKDRDMLAKGLRDMAEAKHLRDKKVALILPAQTTASRELTLPPVQNEKELRRMVVNEMLYRHSGMDSDYVIDYMDKAPREKAEEKDAGNNVLAIAIQTATLEEYLTLVEAAGIRCGGIDVVQNCIGKLFHQSYPACESAITVFITPTNIMFLLMDHDLCVFSQSVRLNISQFEKTDSLDFLAEEISGHLDKILSFQSTRRDSLPVEKTLLMGYKPQLEQLLPLLAKEHEIRCEIFDAGKATVGPSTGEPFSDYVIPLGAMIRRK